VASLFKSYFLVKLRAAASSQPAPWFRVPGGPSDCGRSAPEGHRPGLRGHCHQGGNGRSRYL